MTDNDKQFLPIRVVQSNIDFLNKNLSGGSVSKIFLNEEELSDHKKKLGIEISQIETTLAINFQLFPKLPYVIKARLRKDALVKSHRPNGILKADTC